MNNLPPGVTDSMIPGNRAEDEEIDIPVFFCVGEIDDLISFREDQNKLTKEKQSDILYLIDNILEQLEEYASEKQSRNTFFLEDEL